MNTEARKALEGSIAKWERIVNGTGVDKGHENCPLCREFYGHGCRGCPVQEHTGRMECGGTPYVAWRRHQLYDHSGILLPRKIPPDCPDCQRLAQAEVDFLVSLLPEEKP